VWNITDGNDLPEQETNIAGLAVLHARMLAAFTKCCVHIRVPGSPGLMETALVLECPRFDLLYSNPCLYSAVPALQTSTTLFSRSKSHAKTFSQYFHVTALT